MKKEGNAHVFSRYRLDHDRNSLGAVYDLARPGAILRWFGACQEFLERFDAVLRDCSGGQCGLDRGRL